MKSLEEFLDSELSYLKALLLEKNKSYGNSFADPINIFNKGDPLSTINVRIDDKLKRIKNGNEYDDEDTELDLIGYLLLKRYLDSGVEL